MIDRAGQRPWGESWLRVGISLCEGAERSPQGGAQMIRERLLASGPRILSWGLACARSLCTPLD